MTFINPALLWALPIAGLPILFHLLSKRRSRRRPFSDLTLLRRVQARALPRTRLRQWLLLAARCALILALIFAYAGPVLHAGAAGAGAEGLDLLVLVDVSYSMGARELGKTRLEAGVAQAQELLARLHPGDRAAVAFFSDRLESEPPSWLKPSEAAALLPRARLSYRGTDDAVAWRAAAALLANPDPKRRRAVLVVSDGAKHGLRGSLPPLPSDVPVLGLSWPSPPANSAVLLAGPSRDSSAQRPMLAVRALLAPGASPSLDLWLDGAKAQSGTLSAAAGEGTAALSLPDAADPAAPAWSGRVALRPDALAADDVYYFSFTHPARPRVVVLFGDPDFQKAPAGGYFLKQLFGGGKDSLLDYDVDFAWVDRFDPARLAGYRGVVLADVKELPSSLSGELETFVRRGGGLWLVLGGREEAPSAGFSWLPASPGPLVSGEGPGIRAGAGLDPNLWRQFDLSRVTVDRYYLLQAHPGSRTLFSSASGYPLLVSGKHGAGRVVVWASGLDTAWTNLALKPAFAAFVQSALDAVTGAGSRKSETLDLKVGEPIVRVWAEDEPAPASVRLRAPDGRATTLWLKERRVEAPTDQPGLYAMSDGERSRVYAVNLDRADGESDLAPLSPAPWKTLRQETLAADFEREVYGKPAREAALGVAAAAAALEMLLSLPQAALAALALGLLLWASQAAAQQGDRFVWTQLKIGPQWDPYPTAPGEILELFGTVTSVLTAPERRVITLKDKALFSSPLVVLAGSEAPPELDADDVRNLRDYISAGGMLWIEDVSGSSTSSFDRWVRRTLSRVLPEAELAPIPPDHVIFKTFFLLRAVGGRVLVRGDIEGVDWGGRMAVVYSRNDLLGVWAKDNLGQPLYPCVPGGEAQRHLGRKLTLNILMYSLTGSYKADAVHQPYILQKMRMGVP